MVAPQNEAFDKSALLKFTSQSSARSNTARYRSAPAKEVVMICASLNCASLSSAPLNSFHLIVFQSGGGSRNRYIAQLIRSYQLKPRPFEFLASVSMWIKVLLKEAEGN